MDKRFSNHEVSDFSNIDAYWKVVFAEIGEILLSHFPVRLAGADLFDEADKIYTEIFICAQTPHAGRRDIEALLRLEELLFAIEQLEISDFARSQIGLWAASQTNFAKRQRPLGWSVTQTASPHDANFCLFEMHRLLKEPIQRTRQFIELQHVPNSKTNAINWKGVDTVRACLVYWNETMNADRGFGQPKLETKFGQFVHDIWSYFDIEGSPASAMNALKKLEGDTSP